MAAQIMKFSNVNYTIFAIIAMNNYDSGLELVLTYFIVCY